MHHLSFPRRSILAGAGALGIGQLLAGAAGPAQAAPQGFVLGANGGEHLVHFRNPGNIFIKAGAATNDTWDGRVHTAVGKYLGQGG